jgi:integrase
VAERLPELEREAKDRKLGRETGDRLLREFCEEHINRKRHEVGSAKTIRENDRALRYLIDFLGDNATVAGVTVEELTDYRDWRLKTVRPGTVNHELSAISNMMERAVARRVVERNEARHVRLAREERTESVWLEIAEGVRLLEAAKALEEDPRSRAYPHIHALLTTFLCSGGRRLEVLGLDVADVDFETRADGHGRIHLRPNRFRQIGKGFKGAVSVRSVPLWPQLNRTLRAHVDRTGIAEGLVFPSHVEGAGMLQDVRDAFASAAEKAKITKAITHHTLRHTYAAVRLQTVDAGEPVALYTVARELGHAGTGQIESTYGHVLDRRVRLSEVRFESADVIDLASRRKA